MKAKKSLCLFVLIPILVFASSCGNTAGPQNSSTQSLASTSYPITVSNSSASSDLSSSENNDNEYSESTAENGASSGSTNPVVAENNSNQSVSPDDIIDKIDVAAFRTMDGELCTFITNNSETIIDELDIQAIFLDDAGSAIDTDSDGHDMILPGYTVVSKLYAPSEYADVTFDTTIELGVNPNYANHSDNVSVSAHDGAEGIIIEITNNGTVTIDELEYITVFYLGDQISHVGYAEDIYDLAAEKTEICKEDPYGVEYDRYEVYLNQAHTFGL